MTFMVMGTKSKRHICAICRRKRVEKRLKRVEGKFWACRDGDKPHCCDHPDFDVYRDMKKLSNEIQKLRLSDLKFGTP